MNADDFVGGHSILALERFMDETRHMIIFDVLSWKSPVGEKGERLRLFLSDVCSFLRMILTTSCARAVMRMQRG